MTIMKVGGSKPYGQYLNSFNRISAWNLESHCFCPRELKTDGFRDVSKKEQQEQNFVEKDFRTRMEKKKTLNWRLAINVSRAWGRVRGVAGGG